MAVAIAWDTDTVCAENYYRGGEGVAGAVGAVRHGAMPCISGGVAGIGVSMPLVNVLFPRLRSTY